MRILFNILVIVLLPFISLSQISVDNNYPYNSPQYLVEEILLDQCVNSSNHQFHGDPMQLGYFDGSSVSSSNFNFSSGILLATGNVNVIDPSFTGLVYPPPNTVYDPDLLNVANSVPPLLPAPFTNSFTVTNINDVAILEFDFVANSDSLSFNYAFGSSEYYMFENTPYNDVFGFFLSGPGINGPHSNNAINLANVPNSSPELPITVSSVNEVTPINEQYFVDNRSGLSDIAFINGYTEVFKAEAALQIGQTYHIRMAIADGSDNNLNSFVWLEEGSFTSSNFTPTISASISDNNCEAYTDLTINLSQDNGEEDIDYATFTTSGGNFNLSSLQNGDIIGSATMSLSLTTFNADLKVSSIISPNEVEVEAIDPIHGSLGDFTLKNLPNGVEIFADSPDDLNNYTSGNSSSITINNLFQNPNSPSLWFNYDLYSELGCFYDHEQYFSIINCPYFGPYAYCSLSDPGCQALSDLTINVSQGFNEEDIDYATFSSNVGSFDLSSLSVGDNIGNATMNLSLITLSANIIVSNIISPDEVEVEAVDITYGAIGNFVIKNLPSGGIEIFVDSPPDGNYYTNGNNSTITFNSLFQNPILPYNNPINFSFNYTSELGSNYSNNSHIYINCCPFFVPEVYYSLADNYCVLTDLSINVVQYCNDEDISNANFTTNDGSFEFTNVLLGDIIGTVSLSLSSGSFSANLQVSNIISSNEISLDAVDISSGNILGSVILKNSVGGGVEIITDIFNDSPGDGDNYTTGSNSTIFFNNIFENPSNSNILTFTSDLTSELGGSDIQSYNFSIYCIPNIPRLNVTATDPSCPGANDGQFDLSGTGGTGVYNYQLLIYDSTFTSWISIGQSPISGTYTSNPVSFFALSAGCYQIIIQDDAGLSETTTICLDEPQAIEVFELINYTTPSNNDGSIELLNVTGGLRPYVFSWIGPNGFASSSEDIFNLENGTYTLTVTDDNFCSEVFVFLMEPLSAGCTDSIANNFDQYANYDDGTCCYLNFYDDNIILCLGQSVDLLYSNLGPNPDSYLWSTGDISSSLIVSPTVNTNYNLEVTTNGNVCRDSVSVTITCLSFSPSISISLSDLNCGLTDLTINVSQDPDEVDMDLAIFTSDAGNFTLSSLNINDNVGYASMSIGGLSVNADLFVSNIISTDVIEVEAINQITGILLGKFTLENLSAGGIKIEASSPGDGNLYTLSGNTSSITFTNLFNSPSNGFLSFTSNISSELGDIDIQLFPMSLNCVDFSPEVVVAISNTNCDQVGDLTISVSQDSFEVDMDTAVFTSDGGSFLISSLSVGDIIGQASMDLSISNYNCDLVVNSIISSSFLIVESVDQLTGAVFGTFSIENLFGGGVEVIAISPNDGNLYTYGNNSSITFYNLFQNPNTSTVVFSSDISSELSNTYQSTSPFVLNCAISPIITVSLSDLNCVLTDLLITVSQDSNEVDIDSSFFSSDGGYFTISSMNVGDVIGLATMNLSLNSFSADIIVDAIISTNEIKVKSIDQLTGAVLGFFTIINKSTGGIEIIASSPDDGNTFTSGHTSSIIFYNVFFSPSVGFINFNSVIISETGDYDIQDTLIILNSNDTNIVLAVCDSIFWNGVSYDSSGVYIDTILNSFSCDSIIYLDLTVNYSSSSLNVISACDSINWNGISYDSSGIYLDTLTNFYGCDSIVVLDLTVNYTTSVFDTVFSCDSLIWNGNVYNTNGVYTDTLISLAGCDSIVTINLFINNANSSLNFINACDSLIWNGLTLTSSGIYDTVLTNIAGCDSLTQIYLTIIPSVYTNLFEHACETYSFNGIVLDSTGVYSDTLNSFSGCDSVVILDLIITPKVEITVNITDVACYGDATGEIDISLISGSPSFAFQWSNGATVEDVTNLYGDSIYNCVISDSAGCTLDTNIYVSQPDLLSVSENINNVSCFNGNDGSVVLNITGGFSPYIISWGAIDTFNISAGYYSYLVTDSNGCTVIDSVEVTQPNPLQINVNTLNIQCFGQSTGYIEIDVVSGSGTPGYSYEWVGPNLFSSFSSNIYDLFAGNYNLILTDTNSCIFDTIITLTQPVNLPQFTEIQISDYSGFNIACKGDSSGWVSVVVTGGYEPYTYLWSNSQTSDSIYDLFADTYILEVTDSLGCVIVFDFSLIEPAEDLSSNIVPTTNYNGYSISCYGLNDAAIYAIASGGVPNYRYFWDGVQGTDTLVNISAGDYELTVKDQNNCVSVANITLIQPDSLFNDIASFTDTCSKGVGLGNISVFGGVTPYSYLWSNGSTLQTVVDFSQGNYQVIVNDANLCEISDSIYIDNLPSPIIDFGILPDNQRLFDQLDDPIVFVDYTNGIWQNIVTWIWDFDDGAFGSDSIAYHSYSSEGLYQVMLTTISEYNCIDTLTKPLIISDYNLYIPNAFTPFSTDDEYNNIFKAYGIGIVSFKMDIHDRWGGRLFTSNSLDVGWDGTTEQGNQVPVGVYIYNIVAENVYGEIFKYVGQVKLIR